MKSRIGGGGRVNGLGSFCIHQGANLKLQDLEIQGKLVLESLRNHQVASSKLQDWEICGKLVLESFVHSPCCKLKMFGFRDMEYTSLLIWRKVNCSQLTELVIKAGNTWALHVEKMIYVTLDIYKVEENVKQSLFFTSLVLNWSKSMAYTGLN